VYSRSKGRYPIFLPSPADSAPRVDVYLQVAIEEKPTPQGLPQGLSWLYGRHGLDLRILDVFPVTGWENVHDIIAKKADDEAIHPTLIL